MLAVHQDCVVSRTWERERDQTHSYWYKPSALRLKYALLIVEAAGMMNMATRDDSLLRQGARTGSWLVFGGYRGLRRWNSRSRFLLRGFSIYRNFWRRSHVRGSLSHPRDRGVIPRGRVRPPPLCPLPCTSWPNSFAYIYSQISPNHQRHPQKHFSTTATFYTHEIPSRGLFRCPVGGGFDHGGLLHQHHYLSDEAWVQTFGSIVIS